MPSQQIDLHAESLLSKVQGLSNGDILQCQLEAFTAILTQYKSRKGYTLIFIHGKGSGKLRSELLKSFRQKYNQERAFVLDDSPIGFWQTAIAIKIR